MAAAETGALGDRISVEITSEREGYRSWQSQVRQVNRTGYGLHWGEYWGGL